MNWREHIRIDPAVCEGQACIKGTHIMASTLLDLLASGTSAEEILRRYPSVKLEDLQAVMAYTADLVREQIK